MKFESGSFGTDSSGNGNNMTVGAGTMTRTKDNPDNNFLVLNPLDNFYPQYTFGYGNTRLNKTKRRKLKKRYNSDYKITRTQKRKLTTTTYR